MRVIDCPVCGARVNALVHHCPDCGADPRLPREAAEADLRARGIPLPGEDAANAARNATAAGDGPASAAGTGSVAPGSAAPGAAGTGSAAALLPPPDSVAPGPAAWPAVVGAALFVYWGAIALPLWLAVAFVIVYPLFVRTAEHRRCRELKLDASGGLHLLLGAAAGAMWVMLPAAMSERFSSATVMIYRHLEDGALLGLVFCVGVTVPLLIGLVFRYAERWAGSVWALVVVMAAYVALGFDTERAPTSADIAWSALAGLVLALAYMLTRRLWLSMGLRTGMALLTTDVSAFSLDLVKVTGYPTPDLDATFHLAFLAAGAAGMLALALRRGTFVTRRRAWHAQTGLPDLPPPPDANGRPSPSVSLWAALGGAALLDGVYWYTGGPLFPVALALPALYWVFVRLVERRRCVELGGGPVRAAAVLVLGLAGGLFLGLLSWMPDTGPFAGSSVEWPARLSAWLVASILLWALAEEVIWRGLLQRSIERRLGSVWALGVAAVAFAAWHMRWDPLAFFDLALAGALFGAAFLLTRRLWLPTGIHAGWNIAVSAWAASEYRTGYTYLLIVVLESMAIAVLLVLARQRGRLVPRPRLGGCAPDPMPSEDPVPRRRRNVMACRTCGADVNVRIARCPECGADPRLPREGGELDRQAVVNPSTVGMDPSGPTPLPGVATPNG